MDYKLLSKIISNSIKNELNTIINEDQSEFLKGRNIADNIRKVSDTLEFCNQRQVNALLISIDFEKAFNRVEYSSLWKALEYFNFGSNIIAWSKLLYNDFALCVTNNDHLSNFFTLSRGLFQGNPDSSYGFLIIIELLTTMVRNKKNIEGIQVGYFHNLLSMFADDLDLFIQNSAENWRSLWSIIENFEIISGLKVNYNKTSVYRIGSARNSTAKYYSKHALNWSSGDIECLGITISGENTEDILTKNLSFTFKKMDLIMQTWLGRGLSLCGKTLICNALLSSLLTYKITGLPTLSDIWLELSKKYS